MAWCWVSGTVYLTQVEVPAVSEGSSSPAWAWPPLLGCPVFVFTEMPSPPPLHTLLTSSEPCFPFPRSLASLPRSLSRDHSASKAGVLPECRFLI